MATLEKIRSKAGVIVAAVIGLALFAFILQDLLDSRKSIFAGSKNDVGEIAGSKIPVQRLEDKINEVTENYKIYSGQSTIDERTQDQLREQAWQQIINEEVMNKEFKKLGLTVSGEELADLFQGANPDPAIRQIFVDPKTGQFSRDYLNNFLRGTSENPNTPQMKFRLYLESDIQNRRINAKYGNLIAKGITAPNFLAKNDFVETNLKVNFNYIVQRYTSIPDDEVKITADDLKSYYNSHKYLYDQTASRDIEYVSFDVVPSKADREAALDWIEKIKPDFISATDVETFVNQNSDVPYADRNYNSGQLTPDSLNTVMFNGSVGDVYGPYIDNDAYKLARLYKIEQLPDSVKARHILIAPKGQTQADVEKAKSLADSLKQELDKGADFAALAEKFSDDKNSAVKGGDLGWFKEGMMLKPFNDAAFEAKKNDIKVIQTQVGYHILQVTDRGKEVKKVKVAIIVRNLTPSQRTYSQIYAQANRFASDNRTYQQFNGAVTKQNLSKRVAPNLTDMAKSVPGIDDARSLVKWAFKAKKNEVSEPITLGDHYIVAAVTEIREKGTAPLDQVRSEVEVEVSKLKKAEKIAENINKAKSGAMNIRDLALKLNSPVDTASGITFSSFSLPATGVEPKVIATATNIAKNKLSAPVDGNIGVYVLYVTDVTNPIGNDYSEAAARLNADFAQRGPYQAYNALRKAANIIDTRSLFY